MDLLKCACGCDKLSKDELEVLINSTDRVHDFLNNAEAIAMFKRMFENKPAANTLKYLNYITMAKEFMANPSRLADEDGSSPRTFTGMIDEELAYTLLACTDDDGRKTVLEEIIKEYSLRLSLSRQYKEFQGQLKKAYQGKVPIRKSD